MDKIHLAPPNKPWKYDSHGFKVVQNFVHPQYDPPGLKAECVSPQMNLWCEPRCAYGSIKGWLLSNVAAVLGLKPKQFWIAFFTFGLFHIFFILELSHNSCGCLPAQMDRKRVTRRERRLSRLKKLHTSPKESKIGLGFIYGLIEQPFKSGLGQPLAQTS